MGSNRLARQSFDLLKIRKDGIYFLSYACGRRKKEGEQNGNFQVWFFQTCERLVELLEYTCITLEF